VGVRAEIFQQEFVTSFDTKGAWAFLKSIPSVRWRNGVSAFLLAFYNLYFGYWERPYRLVRAALIVICLFAFAYFQYGPLEFSSAGFYAFFDGLWKAFYFSSVTFTNLGYGSWVTTERIAPDGWPKYLGAVQSFIGAFTIGLFLVAFGRKLSR
jgi:hypothetical protein